MLVLHSLTWKIPDTFVLDVDFNMRAIVNDSTRLIPNVFMLEKPTISVEFSFNSTKNGKLIITFLFSVLVNAMGRITPVSSRFTLPPACPDNITLCLYRGNV